MIKVPRKSSRLEEGIDHSSVFHSANPVLVVTFRLQTLTTYKYTVPSPFEYSQKYFLYKILNHKECTGFYSDSKGE